MGNEKGRKRLDSINVIFREKVQSGLNSRVVVRVKMLAIKAHHVTIAVGVQTKVTCQKRARSDRPLPPAWPPKFRPRSTGGRKSEVGILARN